MSRLRYFAFRTAQTVFLLWLVMTFLFFLLKALPGSFLDVIAMQNPSPEKLARIEAKWGLNDPLYIQYLKYVVNFVQLDFGQSFVYREPVWEYVRMRIFNTFILVAPALTVTYILGAVVGAVLGSKRGEAIERYGITIPLFVGSFPAFFVAIFLVLTFALWLPIFPTSGMIPPDVYSRFEAAPWWRPYFSGAFLNHYILPFSAVVMRYLIIPSTIMRTSVVDIMDQEFTYYHRITGLSRYTRLKHTIENSMLPVLTMYPVSMAQAISGLVLIEIVFNWPGIGAALVQSVLSRDFPVMMFVFWLTAAFVITANYVVDILYGIIDPRISVGE